MPELPEVETVRRSLVPRLVGRRVEQVRARRVRMRAGIAPEAWHRRIRGAVLEGIDRRGKYLVARFGANAAVFHLGMSGRMVLSRPGEPDAPHTHLALEFDHGIELRLVDPRRFGMAVVINASRVDVYPPLAGLGPDPLGPALEPALLAAAGVSRAPIRNLLLDQAVAAGVGNIYANEALFRAGIHPGRRANRISRERIIRLGACVREVLEDAITAGGTTLADGGFVDAEGEVGYFAVKLGIYGREGEACTRCGTPVSRRALGNRSAYFCRQCQR